MSLKVLITAAASGIGLEMARAFDSSGAQVYICDIDAEALQRAAAELPGVETSVCDVGDREAVKHMVAEAARRLGGIDVLINNAGIGGPTKSVQDLDPADWDAVLRINLTGVFDVTRNAIPHLIKSERGVIINMSSAAGRFGYPNRSPYAASKWALIGFTKTLSMELGEHGVRVNAIAPGAVAGDRVERVFQGRAHATGLPVERVKEIAMTNQSIKHLVDPKDVAALALFLASDAAKAISGQVLPIDCDMQRN
jgi:NAD(P)-dependent dehydrogenase (short-subunit alcohol dehydrogenase family)